MPKTEGAVGCFTGPVRAEPDLKADPLMTVVDEALAFTDDLHEPAMDDRSERDGGYIERSNLARDRTSVVPPLVRASRAVAVMITAGIAVSSFVLSFAALSDLARRTGSWTGWLPFLWPGIVDGAIVLATMGILATAAYPDQRRNRQFFWAMLTVGALVSIGGNALHAILPADAPLPTWLAFAVACVPPAGILGSTHAVQILWRFDPCSRPEGAVDSATYLEADRVVATAPLSDRGERWLPLARGIHGRGRLTNHTAETLSQVLWRLFEVQPPLSQRAIGEEVDLHHDAIGRIRSTAIELARSHPELVPRAVAIDAQPGLAS